jgi:ABC-2 type transport system permease protein
VAWWEFLERVKTKSFIISLFITPAIMALFIVVPAMLKDTMAKKESSVIVVYDGTGVLLDSLQATLDRSYLLPGDVPACRFVRLDSSAADMEPVKQRMDRLILSDSVEGALYIPTDAMESRRIEYRSKNVSDIEKSERFERAVSNIIIERRLTKAGLDSKMVAELNKRAELRTVRVTQAGEKESGFLESFGISYVLIILLMVMILSTGQILVRSMVEEKSNRIVEVLVSSCTPMDLMFGKIMGLSMLGLVQALLWSVFIVTAVLTTGVTGLPLEHLWLMIVYFVLGFFLYAAVFVALGCLASTEQEAQQMTGYLSVLMMLPFVVVMIAAQNPNSSILVGISMIPFLTPTMMIFRIPIMLPPMWEIAVNLSILIASIFLFAWVAARIFRMGILMTGKRPSVDEIFRWIRG